MRNGQAVDIVVVDQMNVPTMPVTWLEFAHLPFGKKENKVAICWFFDGKRVAAGIHIPSKGLTLATPNDWVYENSLSINFKFIQNDEIKEKVKFLRHEDGRDVYLDFSTGKEVFVGRP